MGTKIVEVDEYIEQADEFARPILKRLRSAFHRGCPSVQETIKWGIPCFEYHGIVGSIAAFKKHVAAGFWRSREMKDPEGILERRAASMCNARFEKLADLPKAAVLADYVAEAAALNLQAEQSGTKKRTTKKPSLAMPEELKQALAKNRKAQKVFDDFSPSRKRDYIEWISDAKREATRERRVKQAVEWISEGKSRNWKYEKR